MHKLDHFKLHYLSKEFNFLQYLKKIDNLNMLPEKVLTFSSDFPKNSETYLHRIGRSGRFGINLI
jgi:hypothetical protein